jgi:hypothetical protein
MKRQEFERRFKDRIYTTLMQTPTKWHQGSASAMANDEWDNNGSGYFTDGWRGTPESAADEAMSYWADGANRVSCKASGSLK